MTIQGTGCGIKKTRRNFTLAWTGRFLLAAVFGALCLSPAPAAADFITFDLNSAKLEYEVAAQRSLSITENAGSDFLLRVEDGIDVLDSAKIVTGANFNFNFDLTMLFDPAPPAGTAPWSAIGTLEFTDMTMTNVAVGDFVSRSVIIYPYGGGVLQIEGTLSNNVPILRNSGDSPGDPWEFVGQYNIPGEHDIDHGLNGIDGEAGQITVNNPGAYDEGAVFVLKFGVNTHSLDELFGSDFLKVGGEVKGNITPEPATLGLLAMGGVTLLVRRKRKHTV